MEAGDKVYRELQRYLDRLPGGFPQVESGLDMRLLKRFFTPEEAALAMELSMQPETLARIYSRVKHTGISLEELKNRLDLMMRKGTILTKEEGFSETHYCSAEFAAGGIYNFQVNRLSRELIADWQAYQAERRAKGRPMRGSSLPLRTVPVETSIPVPEQYGISDYDSVRQLVESARGKIAVANCICRQTARLTRDGCAKTGLEEACLLIGPDHAKRHVEMGIARYISKEEAFEILDKAQRAGLVLQPENSQRPEAICCCCGDCCVLLTMLVKHPRPVELYATNFYVEVDRGLCTGCGECVKICQLDARVMKDGIAEVNLDRCIGCGNCVAVCSSRATILRKKASKRTPAKDKDTYNMGLLSGKKGKLEMMQLRAKMKLGMKV